VTVDVSETGWVGTRARVGGSARTAASFGWSTLGRGRWTGYGPGRETSALSLNIGIDEMPAANLAFPFWSCILWSA
jgi:hypothetical protein